MTSQQVLGIDIGGTFTDFILVDNGQITVHKRLTTPSDPAVALLDGVAELNLALTGAVVHGSTIATNALLERRGARTALITTRGFADIIEIGRQTRPDLYALVPRKPLPLVPPEWCFEISERVAADGTVLIPLDLAEVVQLTASIHNSGIESVAICFLFSFLYPDHEQVVADTLRDLVAVSLSSKILPEYREYERASTTVINAYVAPLMERYLTAIEQGLKGRHLRVMQSNGGVITAATARKEAARTVLSGPAGGAVGAFHVAGMASIDHIISFDMGGTSTDVALFPGKISYTRESIIGGMPLHLPIVDIHTVGAGGGSIARVDAGGALQVGPQSAGADPGPACYGRSDLPTTSDANLVLSRLNPEHFLGGTMALYPERARDALTRLAREMRVATPEHAAWGAIQVANAAMQRAIRAISVERGHDPREFTLVPFGGAGPLHACALADALHIPRILIPRTPGVLSALGMTIADLVKDYSRTVMSGQEVLNNHASGTIFAQLEDRARYDLIGEGIDPADIVLERAFDLRYAGQSHEITVTEPANEDWAAAFHAAHWQQFGHQHPDEPLVVVAARLRAVGRGPKPAFKPVPVGNSDPVQALAGEGSVWFRPESPTHTTFYARDRLKATDRFAGPAVVFQLDTTILVEPGWMAEVDEWGNIVLRH